MTASLDITGCQPDTYVRGYIASASAGTDDTSAFNLVRMCLDMWLMDEGLEGIPDSYTGHRLNSYEYQVQCHAREASR